MAYDKEVKEAMARDFVKYVGMQIRLRRTELNMKISDVSELTGISIAALSLIERGEKDFRASTLAVLRSALALDIEVKPLKN